MKKALWGLVWLVSAVFAFGQQQVERPYWYTLEQGKAFFRNGEYGRALLAFEDAKRNRKAMYDKMEQDLIVVLSVKEVRRMNDSLNEVEQYIAENYLENANAALQELYYRIPKAGFGGAASSALKAIGTLKDYPEAEYWIGETYRIEGELVLALRQYKKAHEQRANLETPGFDVEILYRIVDMLRMRQEYVEMERWANEIIALDTLWSGDTGLYTRNAMSKILESDGLSRFLTIYRYDNAGVEHIHRLMGFYYYASGRHGNASDHLMFSLLIQNTIIINELIRRRYDFEVTTMDGLLREAERSPVLAAYMEGVEYYKTLYYLGAAFYANGKTGVARSFWALLSGRGEAGQWAIRAASQLKSPFIERAQEMP
jgi:tetratricopeptide (TPR) repeat protein